LPTGFSAPLRLRVRKSFLKYINCADINEVGREGQILLRGFLRAIAFAFFPARKILSGKQELAGYQ
jgi:hypothetical protein